MRRKLSKELLRIAKEIQAEENLYVLEYYIDEYELSRYEQRQYSMGWENVGGGLEEKKEVSLKDMKKEAEKMLEIDFNKLDKLEDYTSGFEDNDKKIVISYKEEMEDVSEDASEGYYEKRLIIRRKDNKRFSDEEIQQIDDLIL